MSKQSEVKGGQGTCGQALVTAGVNVHVKVYIAIMRPATDAGRADVVFDLAKMMADDGKPPDNAFSFACRARAHLLVGPGTDVARHVVGFHHRIPFYGSKRVSMLWQAIFVRVVYLYTLSSTLLLRLVPSNCLCSLCTCLSPPAGERCGRRHGGDAAVAGNCEEPGDGPG